MTTTTAAATTTSTISTTTTTVPGARTALVVPGSTWRYLDTGSNQGTAWRAASFNDSSWRSGPAPLGCGDSVRTTVRFGSSSSRKYITSYFRQGFTAAAGVGSLSLRIRGDDGAVVYINGTEVVRTNMPSGTISSSTLANVTVSGSGQAAFTTFVIPGALAAGSHVIAVEIHQASRSSPDIVLDAELTGRFQ